jgi:hypothetical protein
MTPNISDNVRAEAARKRRSGADVARAIDMPRATWQRRMDDPDLWTVVELRAVARELDVPLSTLTGVNGPAAVGT